MIWTRRLVIGVAAALLLGVIAWLGIPQLLKWQLPLQASAALDRAVTIGGVNFKPWSLELTLDDVAVAGLPSAGTAELLRVARIHADLSIATFFKRAPGSRHSRSTRRPCALPVPATATTTLTT